MLIPRKPREKSGLEKAIDRLHDDLKAIDPWSDQYATAADNLTKLYKLRENDSPRWQPNPDVVLTVVANLVGIGMIVGHERANIVTSKALTFVRKLG